MKWRDDSPKGAILDRDIRLMQARARLSHRRRVYWLRKVTGWLLILAGLVVLR